MNETDKTMLHPGSNRTKAFAGLNPWLKAVVLIAAAPLAGCATGADRITTATIQNQDYRARHPIELANSRAAIDVIPLVHKGTLDDRSIAQIKEFAREYSQTGSGDIAIALPQGGPNAAEAQAAVPGIRHALVAGGARGYTLVSTYPIADPTVAAPIRLSFATIVARTRTRCGQWPNDLASGSSVESWDNKPYWNFGCASQQMIAAQTADPRDLISPAATSAPDSIMRARGIAAIRQGKDPSTSWSVQNSNIGGVGN